MKSNKPLRSPIRPSTVKPTRKRVGATVAVEGVTPLGQPPFAPYGGYGCGYPPFYPPPPVIIIDGRRHRRERILPRVSASIVPGQVIPAGVIQQLLLTGTIVAEGQALVSGNAIFLPRRGTYLINLNVTVTRDITSTSGAVLFSVTGGIINPTNIAGSTVDSGNTQVFSGSIEIFATGPQSFVFFNVSNNTPSAGPVTINSGTVTAQWLR